MLRWFRREKVAEDMLDRLGRLEKAMARMEEEWTEVYGKFRRMQMRIAKQVQRIDEQAPSEATESAAGTEGDGTPPGPTSLSPRLQALQQQILARRRRMIGGT